MSLHNGRTDARTVVRDPLLAAMGGRPVLLIPYIGPGKTLGERVVVAWDASRAAARAVRDALPFLTRAAAVQVVSVNPRPGGFGHGEVPGNDIALYLARHGVNVEVQHIETRDLDVGNALLSVVALAVAIKPFMGQFVPVPKEPHEAPPAMLAGPLLFAGLGVLLGLLTGWLSGAVLAPTVSAKGRKRISWAQRPTAQSSAASLGVKLMGGSV